MATRDETAFERDLLDRGYSRRQLAKVTALLGAGAAAFRATGALAQQAAKPVAGAVRIGANECWTGHFPIAAEAGFKLVTEGAPGRPALNSSSRPITIFTDRPVRMDSKAAMGSRTP